MCARKLQTNIIWQKLQVLNYLTKKATEQLSPPTLNLTNTKMVPSLTVGGIS